LAVIARSTLMILQECLTKIKIRQLEMVIL